MRTKISSGQLFCLFALSRIMYSMLYHTHSFTSGSPLMWAQLAATVAELVISLPVLIFLTKGVDIAEALSSKQWVRYLIKGAYTLCFALLLGNMLRDFIGFMSEEFPDVGTPVIIGVLMCLLWGYGAYLGVEGIARASTLIFLLVILFVGGMALLSEGKINLDYLPAMTERDMPTALEYGIEELSSNWWLPMGAALGAYAKKDGWKSGLGYLLFKLAFVEGLIFLVSTVLWRYMNVSGYPILALGAYARTDFIQQFDSVNMFVWTLNAIAVGSTFAFCGKPHSSRPWSWLTPALGGIAAAWMLFLPYGEVWVRLILIALLGVLLPLAALFCLKGDGNEKASDNSFVPAS